MVLTFPVGVPVIITDDAVSLDSYLTSGQQPGEELLPEVDEPVSSALPEFNQEAMSQLTAMGFPEIRCQKALLATGNSDAEAAMNWLFGHMEDPGKTMLSTAACVVLADQQLFLKTLIHQLK